jgi:hypothetical protein
MSPGTGERSTPRCAPGFALLRRFSVNSDGMPRCGL